MTELGNQPETVSTATASRRNDTMCRMSQAAIDAA
jgi:hypothetical protein